MVYRAMAWTHCRRHDTKEAYAALQESQKLLEARQSGNRRGDVPWANMCVTLGETHHACGNIQRAHDRLQEANHIFLLVGMERTVQRAFVLSALGGVYVDMRGFEQAEKHLDE